MAAAAIRPPYRNGVIAKDHSSSTSHQNLRVIIIYQKKALPKSRRANISFKYAPHVGNLLAPLEVVEKATKLPAVLSFFRV